VFEKDLALKQGQLQLIDRFRKAERQQYLPCKYNPLVEQVCLYQKEVIIKRMVIAMRESFSAECSQYFADHVACNDGFPVVTDVLRSGYKLTIPFVNVGVFAVNSQYAYLHGGLSTQFDEIYHGLRYRTRYIRRDRLSNLPATPKFILKMESPRDLTQCFSTFAIWYPDLYPKIQFINADESFRPAITDTEVQIIRGLNEP